MAVFYVLKHEDICLFSKPVIMLPHIVTTLWRKLATERWCLHAL